MPYPWNSTDGKYSPKNHPNQMRTMKAHRNFINFWLNGEEGNTKQNAELGEAIRHPAVAGANH